MTAPDLLSPLVEKAVEVAAQWHDGTYRKGAWRASAFDLPEGAAPSVPVIAHLMNVALVVQRAGFGDEVVAAALLHDAVEDRSASGAMVSLDAVRAQFGDRVARLVADVTERNRDAEGRGRPWRIRKDEYIAHLRTDADDEAVAISLADKLHNLWTMNRSLEAGQDLFTETPTRRALSAGPESQRWFFRQILAATAHRSAPRLRLLRARLAEEIERFEVLSSSLG